jgi:phage terminase small subunit
MRYLPARDENKILKDLMPLITYFFPKATIDDLEMYNTTISQYIDYVIKTMKPGSIITEKRPNGFILNMTDTESSVTNVPKEVGLDINLRLF